jgi:hypothetical protein
MVELTKNKYGCRVIQKAFEFADIDLKKLLVSELHNSAIGELVED